MQVTQPSMLPGSLYSSSGRARGTATVILLFNRVWRHEWKSTSERSKKSWTTLNSS